MKIVSISGRQGTGKSTAAKLLQDRGFKKISFADPLKKLVSTLYNWDISRFGMLEYKEEKLYPPVIWNLDTSALIERLANLPLGSLDTTEIKFNTRREALQYIGTEVLRKYDIQFHVKAFLSLVDTLPKDTNCVLDDVRFPNELEAIKTLGGICLFVIRPDYFEISNHSSEISITRHDFTHLLLNDRTLESYKKTCSKFFDMILLDKPPKVSKEQVLTWLTLANTTLECANMAGITQDKLVWWARKHLIRLEDRQYTINDDAFLSASSEAAYWAGYLSADGCIKSGRLGSKVVELCSIDLETIERFKFFLKSNKPIYSKISTGYNPGSIQYYFTVSGSLLIDDLKLWNLKPRKGVHNELPVIILNNDPCMKAWYIGLLDGDGSIYRRRSDNGLCIKFLGSLPVLQYLCNWCPIKHGSITQEKTISDLFTMAYHGKYAEQFVNWLNPDKTGLTRKWSKV